MLARCARCQGTFTTDTFGVQTCPHCGSEILLADPGAPAGTPPPPAPPAPPTFGAPPPGGDRPGELPPPPPPPPGGYAPPPGGSGGFSPPPYGPPRGNGPPGGFGGGPSDGLPSPFAERATRGFLAAFFETFKLVAIQPADFFRRVRADQTGAAILFGVLATVVGSTFSALYSWLTMASTVAAMQRMMEGMPEEQRRFAELFMQGTTSGGAVVAQVLLAPVFGFIGIYLVAAVVHLVLMLFKGTPRGFDATLTVTAYAAGLNLLLAIPGCGGLLALVWWLVVLIIGLGEAQRCGPGKAAAAVFAPVLALCLCCCGVAGLGAGGFVQAMKQAAEAAKQGPTNL